MHCFFDVSCWRYPQLAIITLTVLGQAAAHAQGSRPTRAGMSGPQMSRNLFMPSFSPNPSLHLGMIPMISAYGMARPMQAGGMYPYDAGTPYGGSSSYGGSQGYTQGYRRRMQAAPAGSEAYTAEPQSDNKEKSWSSLLTASGLPNDNGRLRWPLGLRILAAAETDELREQIDALFQEAAGQTAGGSVSSALFQEIQKAVRKFRTLLLKDKAERLGMPLAVYSESEHFLNRLERAAQSLQAGRECPEAEDRLKTAVPPASTHVPPAAQKPHASNERDR